MKLNYLYMTVTADKFELPLVIEPKLRDLSKKTGINYHTLRTAFYNGSKISKGNCKCVRVDM